MADNAPLLKRISRQLSSQIRDEVSAFARALAQERGASAVLFYGSNLRTGELEGVLDFYLLYASYDEPRIWPRVSYHERTIGGEELRAKVAEMSLETFHMAASGGLRDTTIWARFVQPSGLIWVADEQARDRVVEGIEAASVTAARLAVALGPDTGEESDYWRALFQATYKAELRVEKPGREDDILSKNAEHFDGLLPDALLAAGIVFERDGALIAPHLPGETKRSILAWWRQRQRLGKPLNLVRLAKATTTFEGAARYAAWKIKRHTGREMKVGPLQERFPLLAAPSAARALWQHRRDRAK
ncbi:MAG: hypothetical protein AAGK17_10440 [Pseudomonadota bacterium]